VSRRRAHRPLNIADLRRRIDLAEARLDEATAAYGRTVVTAVAEVEAALTGWTASRERHAVIALLAEQAFAEAELRQRRYLAGVGAYGSWLEASRARVGADSLLATAQRDLAMARLALHRALGGHWINPQANETGAIAGAPGEQGE